MRIKKQNNPQHFHQKVSSGTLYLTSGFLFMSVLLGFAPLSSLEESSPEKEESPAQEKQLTDWEARLEYARLLRNLQRYEEALVQYHMLLKEKPGSNKVQIEIAQVLYYQGKHKEALELLEKMPPEVISDKVRLQMAEIYQALKEYSQAESIYRAYLNKKPQADLVKFKLAELLSWQKKYEESILLYRQILADNPNDIQVRRKYAMVLMWMGNESEAAQELEKTLKE